MLASASRGAGGGLGVPGPGGMVCSRGGTWFGGYLVRGSLVWGGLLQGGVWSGGGGWSAPGGVPGLGGSAPGGRWSALGGLVRGRGVVCSRGVPGLGGSGPGGPGPGGVCSGGGGCIPACTEADPPPVDRILDTRL